MTFSNFTTERQEFSNLYYSFGMDYLDKMTQNGVCRGTFIGVPGLQEQELTNFVSTLFCRFATTNKPMLSKNDVEQKKKPLLLYITFKDNLIDTLRNMYRYLKMDEGFKLTEEQVKVLEHKIVAEYVNSRLTATGFEITFCEFYPTEVSETSLIGFFAELESMGYSLHFTTVDRIFLLQSKESEKRDIVRRVRNFCVERGTIFISPFLLSDESAALLEAMEFKINFVKEVNGGNYYDECKTLAQELDLEIYIHTFADAKGKYLTVQRGKYRSPKLIEDKYLFFEGFDISDCNHSIISNQ